MTVYSVKTVSTVPISGQKPGTSGLRKQVPVFQGKNYTENFVQCVLLGGLGDELKGSTLVVGGDGRYFGPEAVSIIVKISAANGIGKLIIGQNGFLSTPAVSCLIRKNKTNGGIILTASHNPGGPNGDFGIKFNMSNGGPAPDHVTNKMYELTANIKEYRICPDLNVDVTKLGSQSFEIEGQSQFVVDVIDPVADYAALMAEIFDFGAIKSLISGELTDGKPFRVLLDAMSGATGPYVKEIVGNILGAKEEDLLNIKPLPDFGGGHPDPNLTYAADLVKRMSEGVHDMGAAFDGDGDRNMILGQTAFFVTPGDSLAIIANNLHTIPYFVRTGIKGYARSMPTSCALDLVAKQSGKECFETPTGWKYFGNLMDAGRISICGEESFGTGSDHIREKDGLWAALAWLQILAHSKLSIQQICQEHWDKFGRNVFTRYDYENCSSEDAGKVMDHLNGLMNDGKTVGSSLEECGRSFTVSLMDNFSYTDPIDQSVATKQGIRIVMKDGSRVVFRLSGTGSSGATIRMYIDSFENDKAKINQPAQELLKPLINLALTLSKLKEFTGRDAPTVIT